MKTKFLGLLADHLDNVVLDSEFNIGGWVSHEIDYPKYAGVCVWPTHGRVAPAARAINCKDTDVLALR